MTDRNPTTPDLLAEWATLASLASAAGRARTSRDVASSALDILARATAADAGAVLFDDGGGYVVEASFGFPSGAVEAIVDDRRISAPIAAALAHGPVAISASIRDAPIPADIADALIAHRLSHVLLAPLRASGRLVGVLGLAWRTAPATPPPEVALTHASLLVGPTLENARLVERLEQSLAAERRLADEEAALHSLTQLAEKAEAFDDLAATTIRQIVALARAAAGSYALIQGDRLSHAARVGVTRAFAERVRGVPPGTMTPIRRLVSGDGPYLQPYVEGAVTPRSLASAREMGFTAYAAIPVRVGDRLEAVMMLWFDRPVDSMVTERVLDVVSRIASISLANFRLRERLVASETRYRALFEASPDAILLLSHANEVVDANPAALRLYRTDLDGLRAFLASGTPGTTGEELRHRMEVLRRDGRGVFHDTGIRPDGTTFPEEIGVVSVEIEGDQRYLVIVRDLAEQHQLQQELLQAQKMEAIGHLVSGVAHELNNPLAAIVAFSQLLRRDERLPEDMRRDAELLVQEAERTRRIVGNLLDFARQRPPERYPTSPGALVESVLALQSYTLTSGHIELSVDVPADLPLVDVDRSQLQQVLLNLTLNAVQAIGAERAEGRIWIVARHVGSAGDARVRLSVSDDGPGISEEGRSRLFLPFYTTKAPGEGTGLGLSVSFGIVTAHGGTLRFEPRPGGGATFIVELPASDRAAPERRRVPAVGGARDEAGRSSARRGTGMQAEGYARSGDRPGESGAPSGRPADTATPAVLVLDDEPAIRAFLTKSLRLAGMDPIAVATGEEAVEQCRARPFAAVLVDQRMPGMAGTAVFESVVAIRPELASRFIFMSGDVLNPELRAFAACHRVALLAKPFDVDAVNRLVADIADVVARGNGGRPRVARPDPHPVAGGSAASVPGVRPQRG